MRFALAELERQVASLTRAPVVVQEHDVVDASLPKEFLDACEILIGLLDVHVNFSCLMTTRLRQRLPIGSDNLHADRRH
jgi:hypothetical protein